MKFTLRTCIDQDLTQVLKVEKESFTYPYNYSIFRYYLHDPLAQFIVADQEGQIIGYIIYVVKGRRGTIISIAVLPSFRRRGIGKKLLDYALRELSLKVKEIVLQVGVKNKKAVAFYKAAGFKVEGMIQRYYPNGEDAFEMSINLLS